MSWWHRDYKQRDLLYLIEEMQEDFKWDISLWVPDDERYRSHGYYRMGTLWLHKPPKRFYKLWIIYYDMLHDIDYDVSGDSTVYKDDFDNMKKKILKLLDSK